MKTLFRILGTAAAVAVTGAAIVALDKILNQKDPLHVEEGEFPEEAEQDAAEAEETAEAYAEAEAKAADDAAEQPVGLPHGRRGDVLAVFDEFFGQQRDHTGVSLPLDFAGKKKRLVKR